MVCIQQIAENNLIYIKKDVKNDDIIDHHTHFSLYYFDFNRLAAGRQGGEYGRCFWRIQPNRFRFQRRGDFSGKNDGGGSHYFYADVDHLNLYGIKKNISFDRWGISPCDQASGSRSAKTRRTACITGNFTRHGEYTGCCTGSEVRFVLFISANRKPQLFKNDQRECGSRIEWSFAAEVVELVDTLS